MEQQTAPKSANVRKVAVRTLMAVTLKGRSLDVALEDMASGAGLDARDRAFALNLVMLCLRRHGSLRHLISVLLEKGLPRNATWTEAALLTGLAQILLMRTSDHAAVNETVDLIKGLDGKERGFAGLVNAVLRRAVRERDSLTARMDAAPEHDLPAWLFDGWVTAYGRETALGLARCLRDQPPLDITLKAPEDAPLWADRLSAELLPTGSLRRTATEVSALAGYGDGAWWVQDMAAAIPARLLGDIAGKHVLDLCAAPGGKTLQLAAMGARVTAVDRSAVRLKRLHANLARTGLKAEVHVADAASFRPAAPADHILLDAPCSATGTFRRNPDVIWTKSREDVAKLASLQARILDHAFSLLPTGGTLVYCVCSLEPEEGPDQIAAFLARTPDARMLAITSADVGGIDQIVTARGELLCLPTVMADKGGMDGFFAARLTRA